MSVEILRMIERIIGTVSGGMSLYLGYQLFTRGILMPSTADWEGLGVKVKFTRAGPGIFFALFGAAILVVSFTRPISTGRAAPPAGSENGDSVGAAAAPAGQTSFFGATDRQELIVQLQSVNWVLGDLGETLDNAPEDSEEYRRAAALIANLRALREPLVRAVVPEADLAFYRDHSDPFELDKLAGADQRRWHAIDRLVNGVLDPEAARP